MRIINKPGDAVLSENGMVKVNRKLVGLWERVYFPELGRHFYFFDLADGNEPVLVEYFCHVFRASIGEYVRKHNVPPIEMSKEQKPEKPIDEEQRERNSTRAKHGHISRSLNKNEPVTGKQLELVLDLLGNGKQGDELIDGIAKKLKAQDPLDEYERHIIKDVLMPHARLG